MSLPFAPLTLTLWQDVLCPWCFVAEQRLLPLRTELGNALEWRVRPFATRMKDTLLPKRQRDAKLKAFVEAAKEPEGIELSSEAWRALDPPRSSVPALVALEAAKLQGGMRTREHFAKALQRAALVDGLDVSRKDVLLELASRAGLEMNKFGSAFASDGLRRLVLTEHRFASSRGINNVPAIVLGNRWLLSGLRTPEEYRAFVLDCLRRQTMRGGDESLMH